MKLETDFRDSLTSSLNREASFRESVDSSLAKVEASLTANIKQLEKSIVDCLLRRDDMWKKQLDRLRPTSTPIEQRNKAGPTEVSPKVPLAPFSHLVHLLISPSPLFIWNSQPSAPPVNPLMSLTLLSSVRISLISDPFPTMSFWERCPQF